MGIVEHQSEAAGRIQGASHSRITAIIAPYSVLMVSVIVLYLITINTLIAQITAE